MTSRVIPALLITVALICGTGPNRSFDIILKPPLRMIDRRFFGMHIHRSAEGTPWPQVPFGSWRLWDAHVTWADLQPQATTWDFTRLDQYVNLAQAHDVDLLLTLGITPRWTSSQSYTYSEDLPGNSKGARSHLINDWREYVRHVAVRYRGKIRYYEIWNEPNRPEYFTGSPQQMVALSKVAYEVLKSVDLNNTVVTPSVNCDHSGQMWLRRFLAAGGANYADILGAHFYVMPHEPEAMLSEIERIRELMQAYGVKKPLWNTEAGWGPPSSFSSQDDEAAFVVRALMLNAAAGIQRVYWYAWDNTNWVTLKLTDPSTGASRRGALAYTELQQWLVGAQVEECRAQNSSSWSCQVKKNDGERWWVFWNSGFGIHEEIHKKINEPRYFPCISNSVVRSSALVISGCPVAVNASQ